MTESVVAGLVKRYISRADSSTIHLCAHKPKPIFDTTIWNKSSVIKHFNISNMALIYYQYCCRTLHKMTRDIINQKYITSNDNFYIDD